MNNPFAKPKKYRFVKNSSGRWYIKLYYSWIPFATNLNVSASPRLIDQSVWSLCYNYYDSRLEAEKAFNNWKNIPDSYWIEKREEREREERIHEMNEKETKKRNRKKFDF